MMTQTPIPCVVISAVNLTVGGPLSILQDAVLSLTHAQRTTLATPLRIVVLVHSLAIANQLGFPDAVEVHAYPQVKTSWFRRLWFEERTSFHLSQQWQPTLWLALHDLTPRVHAKIRVVYCHNGTPFYRSSWRECTLQPIFALFAWCYGWAYRWRIAENDWVVVQQSWLKKAFEARYPVKKVLVAHPRLNAVSRPVSVPTTHVGGFVFFYPAFARVFKNMEVLLSAMRFLQQAQVPCCLVLTIDGTENRYARWLKKTFADVTGVHWLGSLPRTQVQAWYARSDALLFPSKLETWGLPLSEYQDTGKPIVAADLPYAYESLGGYAPAVYASVSAPFDQDAHDWAQQMQALVTPNTPPVVEHRKTSFVNGSLAAPDAKNWHELWRLLLVAPTTVDKHGQCQS